MQAAKTCVARPRPAMQPMPRNTCRQRQRNVLQQAQRNVVVAVDDTEDSYNAVEWALTNLYRKGDVLHLLHVIPKCKANVPMPTAFLASLPEDLEAEWEHHARDLITSTYVELAHEHKAQVEVDLVRGRCSETVGCTICSKSEALEACVVVVVAHRKSFLEGLMFGSVSDHVMRHAKRPVLLYHAGLTAMQPQSEGVEQSVTAQSL